VLYIVPDLIGLPGGIARYCRHVCRALSDAGERTTVVALRDDPAADARREEFDIAEYIPCGRAKVRFATRAVLAAISNRPRLLLCGHPNLGPLAYALSKLLGVPYAVFLYGTDSWASLSGPRGLAMRRADLCISISEHTARLAAKANRVDVARIAILHNCLDPEFKFDETLSSVRRSALLTVSRITTFEPFKGQELVLKAMPRLVEQFPGLVYDVVGDGDRRQALEQLAADLGMRESVRFHGVVTDDELAAFYSTDAVFVMPSTVEGFGFVFAEAMAHGMPAIGGNCDAGPEVIVDGKTGFVIDPTSVDALVDSVTAILADENSWRTMSEAAIEHARSSFAYPRFRDRLRLLIAELTSQNRAQ
jgi:glycosyltransferase involved in cell wall biosynthesis